MEIYDTVRDVLKRKILNVWSIPPDASVYRAIEIMAEKRIGALLVMNGDQLVGIISERDYARKVVLKGRSSKETRTEEIMSNPVITVDPNRRVDECMKIISDNRVRHLPVVEDHKVIGLVSIGDLVNWIISVQDHTIQQLQNYIGGS